eukprot:TRINITY_DN88050_c0_g1_i1.p1 TRINITY_DN88050_c0_g1~~TRINITY_DN88050_c0_g1_i1.p1  ORF type:complete len:780 (+),score=92.95 TRINITY_DN88050_c0_g1_i1:5610-7949(+)
MFSAIYYLNNNDLLSEQPNYHYQNYTNMVDWLRSKCITHRKPGSTTCQTPEEPAYAELGLTEITLKTISTKNDQKIKVIDDLKYQVQAKIKEKHRLTEIYNMILMNNTEKRNDRYKSIDVKRIHKKCEVIENKILSAHMDMDVYNNLLHREKQKVKLLQKAVERIRWELNELDNLENEPELFNEEYSDTREINEINAIKNEIGKLKVKIVNGKEEYEELQRNLKELQDNYQHKGKEQERLLLKEERVKESIMRLKKQNKCFSELKSRLIGYRDEFARVYKKLDFDDKILTAKEMQDIKIQSERNQCKDKIASLQNLAQRLAVKKTELVKVQLNCTKLKQTKRNNTEDQQRLKLLKRATYEKSITIHKTVSGIKNLLYKLRDHPLKYQSDNWSTLLVPIEYPYDRTVLANVSKLLLLFEQRIYILSFLALQEVKHKKNMLEDIDEPAPLITENFAERTVLDCINTLKEYARQQDAMNSSTTGLLRKRTSYFLSAPEKPKIAGLKVPALITKDRLSPNTEAGYIYETPRENPVKVKKQRTVRMEEIDIGNIDPKTLFPKKVEKRKVVQVEPVVDLKGAIEEEKVIGQEFNDARERYKFELRRRVLSFMSERKSKVKWEISGVGSRKTRFNRRGSGVKDVGDGESIISTPTRPFSHPSTPIKQQYKPDLLTSMKQRLQTLKHRKHAKKPALLFSFDMARYLSPKESTSKTLAKQSLIYVKSANNTPRGGQGKPSNFLNYRRISYDVVSGSIKGIAHKFMTPTIKKPQQYSVTNITTTTKFFY